MPPENPHKTTDTAGQTPLGAMRRRTVITGAAGVGVGAVAGASAHALLSPPRSDMSVPGRKPADIALTDATAGFYGEHQQGIATESQAHARFIAIDLNENLHAEAIQRLLRILTNDAAALTRGTAPLTDQEPELAQVSANLTVTIGFGSRIFDIAAPEKKPGWLAPCCCSYAVTTSRYSPTPSGCSPKTPAPSGVLGGCRTGSCVLSVRAPAHRVTCSGR